MNHVLLELPRRSMVVCLACAGLVAMSGQPAFANPAVGVNANYHSNTLNSNDFQKMQDAGITTIRMAQNWGQVESAPGVYNWDKLDILFTLDDYGISPIVPILYGNGLYSNGDDLTMNSEQEWQGYANYAAALADRYKDVPGITFEFWNEQNSDHFWQASTDGNNTNNARERAANYMSMLNLTVPAVRAVAPNATLISGGVINPGWSVTQAWHDEAMDRGLLDLVDGLGVHFYSNGKNALAPENRVIGEVADLRALIVAHGGDADYPIYHTEWGLPYTEYTKYDGDVYSQQYRQAAQYIRMYMATVITGLEMNVWYEWKPGDGKTERSLVNSNLTDRPPYDAVQVMTDQIGDAQYAGRIDVGSDDDFVLVFEGAGNERVLVVWSAVGDRLSHNIVLDLDTEQQLLPFTYLTATTMTTLTAVDGRVVVPINEYPKYLRYVAVPEPSCGLVLAALPLLSRRRRG